MIFTPFRVHRTLTEARLATSSPGPRRLVKAPSRSTLSPQGGEGCNLDGRSDPQVKTCGY